MARSLLHYAEVGNIRKCYRLLRQSHPVYVDATDQHGSSPLMIAVDKGNSDIVTLLLQHGANPYFVNTVNGKTVLVTAVVRGHHDICRTILQYRADPNQKMKLPSEEALPEFSPLYMAAIGTKDVNMCEILLKLGADPNEENFLTNENIANIGSCYNQMKQNADMMKKVSNGFVKESNMKMEGSSCLLMLSTISKQNEICSILLQHGANVNWSSSESKVTPIHIAAMDGNVYFISILLSDGYGADIDVRDIQGNSPLYYAVQHGQTGAVKLLLEKGANEDIEIGLGVTPLHDACFSGDKETAKLLLKHGADVEGKIRKNLHVACSQGNLEVVKLLVESGADVELFDESGSTPLHCAAAGNHPDVVTYLIYS